MRFRAQVCCLTLTVLISISMAADIDYGPPAGSLLIAGGGSLQGSGILEKFIELAGGPKKRFVIVPTARGNRNAQGELQFFDASLILRDWWKLGIRNVRMLHTADPKVANEKEFYDTVRNADAVWFDGGRQWNLVDSYADTATLNEFRKLLARGGVIGGSSAGATIQGDYLVRGDTSGPDIVMTHEKNHQRGFAFLRRSAIDQHVDTRNRWNDLVPVIDAYPDYVGIGLSEDTAIVVKGDQFEVIGKGRVAVHDRTHIYREGTGTADAPYLLLSPGDRYDMKARRLIKTN